MKALALVSLLALAPALAACGTNDATQGASPSPGVGVGVKTAGIVAQDATLCSRQGQSVYYAPAAPGVSAQCYCAFLYSWDTGATPNTAKVEIWYPNGTRQLVAGTPQKGSGAGKWNDDWASAGCP